MPRRTNDPRGEDHGKSHGRGQGFVRSLHPVREDGAGSSDEGFSLWPLKLILDIVAVAIGGLAIVTMAQLGLGLRELALPRVFLRLLSD